MARTTYGPRTKAWRALDRAAERIESVSIHELFERDSRRFDHHSIDALGLLLDFSRQRLDREIVEEMEILARALAQDLRAEDLDSSG